MISNCKFFKFGYLVIILSLLISQIGFPQQPLNPWTPPEYFPSKAVLIEWDFNNTIWALYSELIDECQAVVEVILVVRNSNEEDIMRNKLIQDGVSLNNISFVHVPAERMWIRDHGPISVMTDTGVAFIDLNDLADSGLDEDLPTNLANIWGLDSYTLPYIFCGGNFLINSYNTLFTTDRIYTNNPNYSQEQIANDFETYMGITEIITVSPQHNDYWGHIDMQIKLLDDTTFIISSVTQANPNYAILQSNNNILSSLTTPYGSQYRIREIPKADNWKTYVNSLILNNKVIIPIYNHPFDSIALQIYQELLPNHEIKGINCNSIIGWEGAIHCITMQLFDDAQITRIKELSVKEKNIHVFPNPIQYSEIVHIIYSVDEGQPLHAEIFNSKGQQLEVLKFHNDYQPYSFKWKYPSGIYTLRITYTNGTVHSTSIISQ